MRILKRRVARRACSRGFPVYRFAPAVTEIQMPSDAAHCSRLRRLVTRLASASLSPDAVDEMELAVGEALSNAVKYGGGPTIQIRVEAMPWREIIVELDYPGGSFDTRITRPTDLRNAVGGFGRFIMRTVTNGMQYTFQDGHTILRLTKREEI